MKKIVLFMTLVMLMSVNAFANSADDFLEGKDWIGRLGDAYTVGEFDFLKQHNSADFDKNLRAYLKAWNVSDRKILFRINNSLVFIDVPKSCKVIFEPINSSSKTLNFRFSQKLTYYFFNINDSDFSKSSFSIWNYDPNDGGTLKLNLENDYFINPQNGSSNAFFWITHFFAKNPNDFTLPDNVDLKNFIPSKLLNSQGTYFYCNSDVFGPLPSAPEPTPEPEPEPEPTPTPRPSIDFPEVKPSDSEYVPYDTSAWNKFISYIKSVIIAVVNVGFKIFAFLCGIWLIVKIVKMFTR